MKGIPSISGRASGRVGVTLSLALSCGLLPMEAAADYCTGPVNGTLSVGDGSTPPSGTVVSLQSTPYPSTLGWFNHPLPGPASQPSFPNSGSYSFLAQTGPLYFPESGGSATCTWTDPCTCTGGFALVFYSKMGNIRGRVTYPNGSPAASVQVVALAGGVTAYTTHTDSAGFYDFERSYGQTGSALANNHWGLPVGRSGSNGPGGTKYYVYVFTNNVQMLELVSNGDEEVNITIPAP